MLMSFLIEDANGIPPFIYVDDGQDCNWFPITKDEYGMQLVRWDVMPRNWFMRRLISTQHHKITTKLPPESFRVWHVWFHRHNKLAFVLFRQHNSEIDAYSMTAVDIRRHYLPTIERIATTMTLGGMIELSNTGIWLSEGELDELGY
jgi:hypothetical protein